VTGVDEARLGADAVRAFVLAGDARFTLRSRKTGVRFTYRVARAPERAGERPWRLPWFVSVLTGPDNGRDYKYAGLLVEVGTERPGLGVEQRPRVEFRTTAKSPDPDSPSMRAFAWFWRSVERLPTELEVWHSGMCGRCGRELTVPESIQTGLGPVCAARAS